MNNKIILAWLMAGAAVYYTLDSYDCVLGKGIFIFMVTVLWIFSVRVK